ncbi:hypothetical protein BHM03_00001169 [Ensete ventricosum]|nr:hypothetical protein BHM03_00001169 [Ensete ventricosum]
MAGTGASICMLGKDLSKMCRPHKGMDRPDLGHLQEAQDTEFSHGEESETTTPDDDDDDDDGISIRQWLLPRSLRYLGSRKQRLTTD